MARRFLVRTLAAMLLWAGASWAGTAPTLTVGEVTAAPYAPVVHVLDTESSLGPLAEAPQQVTLPDLVRYHGHPCDGLVVAAAGMAYGLRFLFPDGVVDRTDLEAAVNRSACYGDVAAYLTGARHRYGTLTVDPNLGDEWILHRVSTGRTVRVRLRPGIKPAELPDLETRLKAAACPADLMAKVQGVQRDYALKALSRPPEEVFEVTELPRFPYPHGTPRPDAAKARCGQPKTGAKR